MIKTNWIEEKDTYTLYVTEGGETLASGCVRVSGREFFIEKIYVTKTRRKEGIGDFAVRLLIRRCYELGGITQRITAPESAVGFFERLGFVAIGETGEMLRQGDIFGKCEEF